MLTLCQQGTTHLVVLDLEWNQNAYAPNLNMPHEIIEIGAVRLSLEYQVLDTLSLVVKPKAYKTLDKHIREVTGITPDELKEGIPFESAFARLLAFCGPHASLCTWGRDDYPVLLRNIKYHKMNMPFDPPLDAQTAFAHLIVGSAGRQIGLTSALEMMNMDADLQAHRAVNDALLTARLIPKLQEALDNAPESVRTGLQNAMAHESLIAGSDIFSRATPYKYQTDAVKDEALCAVRCPICGGATQMVVPFFDTGHDRYVSLCQCPAHEVSLCQMHFKRTSSGKLVMHQRVHPADEQLRKKTRALHEEALKRPPRTHRRVPKPNPNTKRQG